MQQPAVSANGLTMNEIQTHSSDWSTDSLQITLNARIDARLVPCAAPQQGLRLSYGHVVVLDNFIGEAERQGLLDFLTQCHWDHSKGPPTFKWERETADGAGLPRTWGLHQAVLNELATGKLLAMKEVHTRLVKLYPEYHIAHMPAELIQQQQPHHSLERQGTDTTAQSMLKGSNQHARRIHTAPAPATATQAAANSGTPVSHCHYEPPAPADYQQDQENGSSSDTSASCDTEHPQSVDCAQFVGNAAVYGDCYTWHVDADPAAFPPSPWVDAYGSYCNGEPGVFLQHGMILCITWCSKLSVCYTYIRSWHATHHGCTQNSCCQSCKLLRIISRRAWGVLYLSCQLQTCSSSNRCMCECILALALHAHVLLVVKLLLTARSLLVT